LAGNQIIFAFDKCKGCGACVIVCPASAIKLVDGKAKTDRNVCNGCWNCVKACRQEARSMIGEEITAQEVFRIVAQDKLFYETSGGGVTITGGEPLAQPIFTKAVLQLCRQAKINTSIETCGFTKWEIFKSVLEYVDVVLYDIKHMDTVEHKKCTGVGNELILNNLKRISNELKIPVVARTPVVPGYNATKENIDVMAKFLSEEIHTCTEVNLLPYHNLGEFKNYQLEAAGRDFSSYSPSEDYMNELKEIIAGYGLKIK
jgi:pyruvate formate lyase activating enzyme